MRSLRLFAPLLGASALLLLDPAAPPSVRQAAGQVRHLPGPIDPVYAAPGDLNYSFGPKGVELSGLRANAVANAVTATFVVTYDANFDANAPAKAAFQAAVDIWANAIVSPVPIRVNASFAALAAGVLGSAGPSRICAGVGVAGTYYAAALADKLNGSGFCAGLNPPIDREINAQFSSAFTNWEFGTTGVGVAGKYNFMTVVLHELGHGLGFYGSMTAAGGTGSFRPIPDIYDRFAVTGAGAALLAFTNPSAALGAQLVSNDTFFNGTNTRAANSGVNAKLETHNFTTAYGRADADNGFVAGSSYSHVDDVLYTGTPNGLMTWALNSNEVFTDPGPVTRGIFTDEGWTFGAAPCTYTLMPIGATTTFAGGTATVTVTTGAGCAWTAVSNAPGFVSITSGASGTGTGTVTYSVAANATSNERIATLTIAGQTFTITQTGVGEPAITTHPASQTITAGQMAVFTVAASGTPAPTYQWQASMNGGMSFTNLTNVAPYSGVTTSTLTIAAAPSGLNGNQYRAVATNSAGPATSNAATLTVNVAPAITTHPSSQTVTTTAASVSFTAAATGEPAPTYQWQVSINGGTSFTSLTNIAPYSGVTTSTLTITGPSLALSGYQYRAIATNSLGPATSTAATLTVNAAPAFTTHPSSQTVTTAAASVSFTVAATGVPAPAYQWQVSFNGGASFVDLTTVAPYSGVTTSTLTITGPTVALSGYRYRAIATNTLGPATSNAATLTVTTTTPTLSLDGQCVDFSPYVIGYDADFGPHPPPAVIDRLLDALVSQTGTTCITTYGVLHGLGYAFEAAKQRGLKVTAIIFLDTDTAVNSASIAAGIQFANQYRDTIVRVSCGSEVRRKRGLAVAESVIPNCVNLLRTNGVSQPITSIDTWWEWCNQSQPCQIWSLASSLDWIGVNVFPWYENAFSGIYPCTTAAQAADFHVERLQEVAARYPGKSTVLTEFGWPAGPDGFTVTNRFTAQHCGIASEANQRLVLESTIARLNQLGLSGAAFEAFRESWKERHEPEVGPFWGFLNVPPTIATISSQTIDQDTVMGPLPFGVDDLDTPAASLTLAASSSNTTLVPHAKITFGGIEKSRTIRITPAANQSGTTTITLTVSDGSLSATTSFLLTVNAVNGQPTTVSLDRVSLQFAATSNGVAFEQQTLPQTVRISQTGTSTVTWTATPGQPWITVTPTSGTGSATLTVSVTFVSGLPSGASSGNVALAFTGASNTAGPIAVGLTTIPNGTSAAPFGLIDTPAEGSTGVTGSIPVTGWALDDVEVRQVRILRDPVAGEGANLIFIGNAVLVDGSRTDLAALNPTLPRNTRAGWGYLLLTNFLPNQGNGTFRLLAIADDADGHSTLLGSTTITCTNATAIKPFGAIDTPAQGEVISGTSFTNFGWVLARGPALAFPPNGTVSLVIDGVFGPAPTGWASRADLTALFPAATYPGVTNALGVATFNPASLTNGVHTIAWVVTANNGQADGIGSRYFTVANGASVVGSGIRDPGSGMLVRGSAIEPPQVGLREAINAAPPDGGLISVRRGYDLEAPFRSYEVRNGRATVQGEELDRFEVRLSDTAGHEYSGYTRVGDELGPLPIGSHLDPATGVFTWQPGVGFVHAYDLVFVRWANRRAVARQEIRIVLNPKGSNRVGPQVVIDTPGLQQPFVVAGWAIDRDAPIGTGVDTLHVWAYPLTCDGATCDGATHGDPIFVGVAAHGGARPDVAAIFGDRFRNSGYGLTVEGLPPDNYDLAVFAWSTVENRFVPAKVVRLTVR